MNIDEPEQIMSQKFLSQGRQLTSAPVHCSYVSQDHDLSTCKTYKSNPRSENTNIIKSFFFLIFQYDSLKKVQFY